jgi:cyanophycin synthetase
MPMIDFLKKYKVTTLHASVFHIEKLLHALPSSVTNILGFLKILSLGYSSVNEGLRKHIKSKLTKNLFIRYSTNEIGPISYTSLENVFSIPPSVGKPIEGVEVEIVDSEGKLKPAQSVGLIRMKSPGMVDGYLNDEDATKKAFIDGWFYPGDIGKLTEDGQLIHLGRSDDMMIMNGINIYPAQIENAMLKHDDVTEAIAFPLKHKIYQDLPVCAVVLRKDSETSQKELLEYAHDCLGSYQPQLVIILDKSPRNEQGKIIKKELQHLVKTRFNLK